MERIEKGDKVYGNQARNENFKKLPGFSKPEDHLKEKQEIVLPASLHKCYVEKSHEVRIENGMIYIHGTRLMFGMRYDDVDAQLRDIVYTKMPPDEEGDGHIIVKYQVFYGLKGTCTFYFQKSELKRIAMAPDWGMYSDWNKKGNGLQQECSVWKVFEENTIELSKHFPLAGECAGRRRLFKAPMIDISIGMSSRDMYQYSLIISKAEGEYKEARGYALASKNLVENKKKVWFMYREEPDAAEDSGWRFFCDTDAGEDAADPSKIGVYDIETIRKLDPDIVVLVESPIGSTYERSSETGIFVFV